MNMEMSKTLLRVPEILEAVTPLVAFPVTAEIIFGLIGHGDINPLGYIQRIPVFSVNQIQEVLRALQENQGVARAS